MTRRHQLEKTDSSVSLMIRKLSLGLPILKYRCDYAHTHERCSIRDSDVSIISRILELVEDGRPTATPEDKLV